MRQKGKERSPQETASKIGASKVIVDTLDVDGPSCCLCVYSTVNLHHHHSRNSSAHPLCPSFSSRSAKKLSDVAIIANFMRHFPACRIDRRESRLPHTRWPWYVVVGENWAAQGRKLEPPVGILCYSQQSTSSPFAVLVGVFLFVRFFFISALKDRTQKIAEINLMK